MSRVPEKNSREDAGSVEPGIRDSRAVGGRDVTAREEAGKPKAAGVNNPASMGVQNMEEAVRPQIQKKMAEKAAEAPAKKRVRASDICGHGREYGRCTTGLCRAILAAGEI